LLFPSVLNDFFKNERKTVKLAESIHFHAYDKIYDIIFDLFLNDFGENH